MPLLPKEATVSSDADGKIRNKMKHSMQKAQQSQQKNTLHVHGLLKR